MKPWGPAGALISTLLGADNKFKAVQAFSGSPTLFLPFMRLRCLFAGDDSRKVITRSCDLVIEGFPRSGSTYAYFAFRQRQGASVLIAHHLHASAQIKAAVGFGVPTLLTVRRPEEAVASICIFHHGLGLDTALESYVRYHSEVLKFLHGILVVTFEDLISSFPRCIELLNHRFGTRFNAGPSDEASIAATKAALLAHERSLARSDEAQARMSALPNDTRKAENQRLREQLSSPPYIDRLGAARAVYAAFVAARDESVKRFLDGGSRG